MDYSHLPEIIDNMQKQVIDNVGTYQTDAMIDLIEIVQSMNANTLPDEGYWMTCYKGTHIGFADKSMANSDLYTYVQNNENSILNSFQNERCYEMNFTDGTVNEIDPQELITKVNEYGAMKNGELDLYREKLNRECATAIKIAIKANTEYVQYGQHVDTAKALSDVLNKGYSDERIAFITAATVYDALYDGRYSADVKNWAKEQFAALPQSVCEKAYKNVIHDNDGSCHPTILNNFAKKVIAEQERYAISKSIINAVDMLEEITGQSQEDIYRETALHVGIGNQLSLGKIYNIPDETLENIAYNAFLLLEENGLSKEEIIQETGISDKLYNRITKDKQETLSKHKPEKATKNHKDDIER